MASATDALKGIHSLLIQQEQFLDELGKGPRVLQAKKKLIEQRQQAYREFQESTKQVRLSADRKNLDLKTLEKKLEDLKVKLNQASSNREFDIIKGQTQADEMAKSVLEDEVLELLEKIDEEQAKLPELEQGLQKLEEDLQNFSSQFAKRSVELEQLIAEVKKNLSIAEKFLPSEPAEKYRRLVASKGARAMAAVKANSCSNCFVHITPQQRILIKSENILFCTNCGSLLYLGE